MNRTTQKERRAFWLDCAARAMQAIAAQYMDASDKWDQYPKAERLAAKAFDLADAMAERLARLEGGTR